MQQTGSLLLRTKFNKPVLAGDLVSRPELFGRLDASRQLPFILISAPAGYGKSTLIKSYLDTVKWPNAWITLDEGDSNTGLFSQYFLAAIQSIFPNSCQNTRELLKSTDRPSIEILASILADDIDAIGQDFFLVLDDYFRIHDMAIHDLVSRILRHPPNSMHLILITRRDPPLPLINLRAKRQMAEIRVPDLRFNLSEAAVLVRSLLGEDIDDKTIAAMEEKTEGWVTGLYLVAVSFRHDNLQQITNAQQETNETINEYLLSEVYSHIPVAVQDFFLKISILDRFCTSLCDAVCHNGDSTDPVFSGLQFMDWIKKANLFLIPLDKEDNWYQFHRLFRSFLQRQMRSRFSPENIAGFHSLASVWFSQNQLFEEALQHALAAGDMKSGIQLVVQFNQKIRLPEQWQQLDRLVHSFPPQIIESNPDLLFAEACVMYARFQLGKMPQALDKVEKLLAAIEIDSARKGHLQGEIAALRSYLYFWSGDYQSALHQGGKALAKLPEGWRDIRELTHLQMTQAMQMLGKRSAYGTLIDHWVKLNQNLSASPSTRLNEQIRLCFVLWGNADFLSLKSAANNILATCLEADQGIYTGMAHYFLGIVDYYQNNLVQAEMHFRTAWEQKNCLNILYIIQSAFGLALVYRAQGQSGKAQEVITSTVAYLMEIKDTGLMPLIQSFEAELTISQNNLEAANQWADQFDSGPLPPMETFYYPHFTLLKILLARNTEDSRNQASAILDRLHYCVESSHNKMYLSKLMVMEALLKKLSGDEKTAFTNLKQAIRLAKAGGIVRLFVDMGPGIADLLQHLDEGDNLFVQQVYDALVDQTSARTGANSKLVVPLTDRELKVMGLLSKRLTNKEIAIQLGISNGTVKSHTIRIYQKLNAKNRREATDKALTLGIVNDRA